MQKLIEKYRWMSEISKDEAAILERWTRSVIELKPRQTIVSDDYADGEVLFAVSQGRLFAAQAVNDGGRAITRLYFSGDIIGTANLAFDNAFNTITSVTHSRIYRIPRSEIAESFMRHPRIAAMFYTFAALENTTVTDRLVSIGRAPGIGRLAAIYMEIACRRELTGHAVTDPFELNFTQLEIGDAIGLTHVHVNRLTRQLVNKGYLAKDGSHWIITDPEELARLGNFNNRYDEVVADWFDYQLYV